jgi:hypothetical protein
MLAVVKVEKSSGFLLTRRKLFFIRINNPGINAGIKELNYDEALSLKF